MLQLGFFPGQFDAYTAPRAAGAVGSNYRHDGVHFEHAIWNDACGICGIEL